MSEQPENNYEEFERIRKEIENKIQYLENNFEDLTEQQLDDLMNYTNILNEKLHPEIEDIKNQMEKNKDEIIKKGQSGFQNHEHLD